ncbi:MAG: nodulation protein NfeD [Chloroflexi bacterium]|nr:nodulation protein NfeD [Chloroflexota bacterium]
MVPWGLLGIVVLALISVLAAPARAESDPRIYVLTIQGVINPVAARYVDRGLSTAAANDASLVVIRLDTPGGMDSSMREIVQKIVNSRVPVAVYVSPAGGRAASAGTFIVMAGHIAVMAPNTAIGAAHPVNSKGEDIQGSMGDKVLNDAVAYIKSLASQRDRNAEWAEAAVRGSVSSTEREAQRLNVIDFVAPDLDTLIANVDGKMIQLMTGPTVLHTKGLEVVYVDQNLVERFMYLISDPTIAYLLMAVALLGLLLELASPGTIVPGVAGGLAFVLALFSLGMLPINLTGVLLIVLAFVLFIAEIKVVSHGVLTLGGVIALAVGSFMLIDTSSASGISISRPVIVAVVVTITAFFGIAVRAAAQLRHRKASTGMEAIGGKIGVARTAVNPTGMVFLDGELWTASTSGEPVSPGDKVKVVAVNGLTLEVVGIRQEGDSNV